MIRDKDCHKKTDEDLVLLVIEDQDYFLCLLKRYEGKIFNYIRRISNLRDEEIEDVLQDIFIKVYQNLNDFDANLKFSSWLYRIAHNQVVSNFRKIKARPLIVWDKDGSLLNNIASEFFTDKIIDNELEKKRINDILNKLDKKYKEVLVLHFLEEKSYKEVSDILKKPMGTIATLVNRAKKQFLKISQEIDNTQL